MIFEFTATPKFSQRPVVIPLAADDHLDQELKQIAGNAGLDAKVLQQDFKAEFCEMLPLYGKESKIFLIGLGKKESTSDFVRVFRTMAYRQKDRLEASIAINFFHVPGCKDLTTLVEAAVNGCYLGGYQTGRYKSERKAKPALWSDEGSIVIQIAEENWGNARKAAEKGLQMALTQWDMMDLVNAPSNKKIPADLANWAMRSGEKNGFQVEVMDQGRIRNIGLHALLAVNQGSAHPPMFIVMEYRPENSEGDLPKVGLVGKGVTFDTGGISIKPSTNLHYMKSDMGGAAAVFGTMEMAAKLQLPVHLIGVVPATDNSVDAKALKPSDVIESYSGKTIEIIDTDAEGRLILADGIAYVLRHYQPEILIDLATLTGSTVRTLGYHAAAIFTNNDELYQQLNSVAENTGEMVWRFPLWEAYRDDIKSDVADIRNFSGRPIAGAIGAAKFLEFFTEDHPAWAHLDIAGVAFGDSEFTMQKSATAYGVRLLVEYLVRLTENSDRATD